MVRLGARMTHWLGRQRAMLTEIDGRRRGVATDARSIQQLAARVAVVIRLGAI